MKRAIGMVILACCAVLVSGSLHAADWEGIQVKEEKGKDGKEVAVTVPGCFKVIVREWLAKPDADGNEAGLSGFYDLKNDPECKYDYTAPFGGGLFTHKPNLHLSGTQQICPMPGPGPVEVVEANPIRTVIRHSYEAREWGYLTKPATKIGIESTYVIYAPDKIYQTYAIFGKGEKGASVPQVEFLLHTSHAKWAGGKGVEGGGYSIPSPWTWLADESLPASGKTYILHVARPGEVKHGDGQTVSHHKANFLLVLHDAEGKHGYDGNTWIGYRTSITLHPKDPSLEGGKRIEMHAVLHAGQNGIDSLKAAAPYVKEYRQPGTPKCAKGAIVADGFDEAMGCYTLKADGNAADFEVPVDCHWPAFQIDGWAGNAPKAVTVDGKQLIAGKDCLIRADKGRLLLQLKGEVKAGTQIKVDNAAAGS